MFSNLPVIKAVEENKFTQYEKWLRVHGHYLLVHTKDGQMSDTWIEYHSNLKTPADNA